ncbi:MAG: phosphoenolpyruvate--protein phosphotransferase [Gemmataceae bacterium]
MLKKGIPVSPGIAVARAWVLDALLARHEPSRLEAAAVSDELLRLDRALDAASHQLNAMAKRIDEQLGSKEAAIFQGHRLLLRDPALIGKVKSAILHRRIDATSALHEVLEEYEKLFSQIPDEYLRERLTDLRDVIARVTTHLLDKAPHPACLDPEEATILVAPEILPSQAVLLEKVKAAGILVEAGGTTGHAAILARALGIPTVAGLHGVCKEIHSGDLIALDGRDGHVYIRPDAETEAAFRKLQREFVLVRDKLVENRDLESITPDGEAIELLANVNGLADAEMANRTGAVGVGLYRTEYLFLTHQDVPDEEEQFAAYKAVIEASPNKRVTIRSLDLGGDKLLPYFGHEREANPFMGWRSIRLCADYPDFFLTQLRAILRAAAHGNLVQLLFPMIATLEEVRFVKRMVRKAEKQLTASGKPFAEGLKIGAMLEVPAAAINVDRILREVDFISIGSNDLIQYLMAADRDNPKVAHLCEPFDPRSAGIACILKACEKAGKPATLCARWQLLPTLLPAAVRPGSASLFDELRVRADDQGNRLLLRPRHSPPRRPRRIEAMHPTRNPPILDKDNEDGLP